MKTKYTQKLAGSNLDPSNKKPGGAKGLSMPSKRTIKVLWGMGLISIALLATASVYQFDKEIPDPDPQKELESFKIADGFEVSLFASEPMVAKPIQMNWDEDGRLWVVAVLLTRI